MPETKRAIAIGWHTNRGHDAFVRASRSLHWSETFIYNICGLMECDKRNTLGTPETKSE